MTVLYTLYMCLDIQIFKVSNDKLSMGHVTEKSKIAKLSVLCNGTDFLQFVLLLPNKHD